MNKEILKELYKTCQLLGAKSDLLSIIGSMGDTLPKKDVLRLLKQWNKKEINRRSLLVHAQVIVGESGAVEVVRPEGVEDCAVSIEQVIGSSPSLYLVTYRKDIETKELRFNLP